MILRRKLNNGMTVIFEKRALPVVSLAICNKLGAITEESKIKGISHFIEHLVFTGTKTRSHEDISREIEKKGGVLNAFTANQVTSFYFKLPSEHIFSGLAILTDMLNNAIFDREKFEKEKKVILEEIKMYHDIPQYYLEPLLVSNLYSKPFGEWIIGSKESVGSLERDFVFNYFKESYGSQNYYVVIVGDADFEKVCAYLEKNFTSKKVDKKEFKIVRKNGESVEEREGLDQAQFAFGVHAPSPMEKDFYVLKVLDAYLANGMSSRLFLEIREKRGLAYSVKSNIEFEKDYSYYSISAGTKKEAIPEVKSIILKEFENIKNMTEKDLEESKERLIGLRKISREESQSVMESLIFWENSVGAENYYEYEQRIREVTLDQVKKLAPKLIKNYSTAAIVPK